MKTDQEHLQKIKDKIFSEIVGVKTFQSDGRVVTKPYIVSLPLKKIIWGYATNKQVDLEDLEGEAIYHIYEAISLYEADHSRWERILESKEGGERGQLIGYIKLHLKGKLERYVFPNTHFTSLRYKGKQYSVRISPAGNFSLDEPLNSDDNSSKTHLENMVKENSLQRDSQDYIHSHFVNWFLEYREELLTDLQKEKYKQFAPYVFYKPQTKRFTVNKENQKALGYKSSNVFSGFRNSVSKAVGKKYIEAYQAGRKSIHYYKLQKKVRKLESILQCLDKENLTDQEFLDVIIKSMDMEWFNNLLSDHLPTKYRVELNLTYNRKEVEVTRSTLYQVVEVLHKAIDQKKGLLQIEAQYVYPTTVEKKSYSNENQEVPAKAYYLTTYGTLIPVKGEERDL